ncbi:cation diffusion facilitator family transporter [Salinibacterium sp. SWN139]|uniref:cation diffusion facilitator family transporter n=1 Tax=unclassified Salinibacterium TaxID=2632331 RepID=UPI0018CF66C9|nr:MULTISPECIES: cation diffusion facilitator family transporter [unclassified Salinibacterium]MBH0053865.1 cation diffusion facilitator family transporter [Salinibacterium sp. SWN139]MBH0129363.1 cation diffusion facilitator family transporter [Salinibacterium sp. NK8237]
MSDAPKKTAQVRTVVVAFVANLLVAIAKSIAALITGSASMLAESAHSWADAGNEIFLLIAERRAVKPADASHPLGFGRETYVWSLFAAVGLFTAGAVVSVQHGISELIDPEPASDFGIAYLVLAIAAVLEGVSFVQSMVQAKKGAARFGRRTLEYALNSSNTTLRAVLAEDAAALIGLTIAFFGILLHQLTGNSVWDAVGSLAIGLLLGVVAIVLINRNRRFLVGQTPGDAARAVAGRALAEHPEISRVTYLHLEFVGPSQLFVVAAIDLEGNHREEEVARQLRELERSIEGNDLIKKAVLTLSVSDEPSISFD